ncbi:hypothetical protein WMF26_08260 [Sorangium sp. So ce185]|uniref:hypothetical protein n=1 Tax=Sorangium sp. So ce185 TaxID=3133287 RepID=UPI003F626978
MGVFVPVSAIFPEVASDFAMFCSLVRSLSRTDTLFWCARLNLLVSNPENNNHIDKQEYAIRLFFDDEEIRRLNSFATEHGGADGVSVFLRAQLLELIRWTCLLAEDHPDDGKTFEDPAVRRRFVQAAMIASDIWATRIYEGRLLSTGNVSEDRRRAMAAMRQGVSANTLATELMQVLARGVSIYCESFQRGYKDADREFYAATGLTLEQYMACLCAITIHFARVAPESAQQNPGIFSIEAIKNGLSAEMALAIDRYINLESQTADDLRAALWGTGHADRLSGAEPFDHTPLRERPIFRTADGRAIILDQVFFGDKTSVGPLFALVKAVHASGGRNRVNTVFGAFGAAFESYVNELLRKMYPPLSAPLLDRFTCNPHGVTKSGDDVEVADALLLYIDEAVLFETKGVFVREDATQHDGIDAYLIELRKKYGVGAGGPKDRRAKGAGQLAKSIHRLAERELTLAVPDWKWVRIVYPVLVVYDTALSSPGHAEFFQEEFARALEPDDTFASGYMRKVSLRVAPLTVMTIEDLEVLESSVRNFQLVDLLKDYACTTRGGVRMSLRDFMASVQNKYKFIHSKELADRAIKALEETGRALFPEINFPNGETS